MGKPTLIPDPKELTLRHGDGPRWHQLNALRCIEVDRPPVLHPLLQHLPHFEERRPGTVTLELSTDSSLPESVEGYALEVDADGAHIRSRGAAGLFYGVQTVGQLMEDSRDSGTPMPQLRIIDWPSVPYRAVHFDVKHHLDSIKVYYEAIERLASCKINGIIWEFEDKLGYRRQPLVGAQHAISIEEMQALTRFARERHIDISPLVQGLGHASFILKHDAYRDLRDDPDDDWAFCPINDRTYDVQFDLYRDAIEATPGSRFLHVGGDEVKVGKSQRCRESGKTPFELHMHWLEKVSAFAENNGRIPIMWDDMPLKEVGLWKSSNNAEATAEEAEKTWRNADEALEACVRKFPANCVFMHWNYSCAGSEGTLRALQWFRRNGVGTMFASAAQTGSNHVLLPRRDSHARNILKANELTSEHKLDGCLCTAWDDASPHFETYWRGWIAHADSAWSPGSRTVDEQHAATRVREFGPSARESQLDVQRLLEECVSFWDYALTSEHEGGRNRPYKLLALPDASSPGAWKQSNGEVLDRAEEMIALWEQIDGAISDLLRSVSRNRYRLRLLQALNNVFVRSPRVLMTLKAWDGADGDEKEKAGTAIRSEVHRFEEAKSTFFEVFSETRFLQNPKGYLPESNGHRHIACPGNDPNWMFAIETAFNEKLEQWLVR